MSDHDELDGTEAATVALVEQSLPRVTPPGDLFGRILAEIMPEATVVPLVPRSRRRILVLAAGAAAVAAVVLVALVVARGDGGAPVDGRALIVGKSDPSVTGEAVLRGSTAVGGAVHVSLRDVPPAPSGRHYEIWVLRRGGKQMEAVGAFAPATSQVELDLPLPGPGDYAALDISVQENGGPAAHSGTSLAGGAFG